MCVYRLRVCVRACVRACLCVCARARACVCVCVCVDSAPAESCTSCSQSSANSEVLNAVWYLQDAPSAVSVHVQNRCDKHTNMLAHTQPQ
jgi:hypothetical protein